MPSRQANDTVASEQSLLGKTHARTHAHTHTHTHDNYCNATTTVTLAAHARRELIMVLHIYVVFTNGRTYLIIHAKNVTLVFTDFAYSRHSHLCRTFGAISLLHC